MTPTRTCVGCRRALPADALIRVVRRADGDLVVDRNGPGRGAWLCRESTDCFELAVRRHAFDKAFGTRVEVTTLDHLGTGLGGA